MNKIRAMIVGTSGARIARVLAAGGIACTVIDQDGKALKVFADADAAFRAGRMREVTLYPYTSRGSRRKRAQWKAETSASGTSRLRGLG